MKICKNGQKGERKHEIRKTDKKNRNALHDCSYCGLPVGCYMTGSTPSM